MLVQKLFVLNGSSAGGNVDIGIYDETWARIVSTGSTVGTGNNITQSIDVTDTALSPGKKYFLVISRDNTTANRQRTYSFAGTADSLAMVGVQDSSTNAFPLPDPLTNMGAAATITVIPLAGIEGRAIF